MILLYISPQFPYNFINFITRLKSHGATVLGVASDHFDQLPDNLKAALGEYYQVSDMNDYGQLLQAGKYFIAKYGQIDCIESNVEYWLTFEGALREDLSVKGKNRAETARIRHKSLMKEAFIQAGIPVAKGQVIQDLAATKQFADQVGYPLIIKPDDGMGAADTWCINNSAELEAIFKRRKLKGFFVEEFVDGAIETFDGLCDQTGKIVYSNSLRYKTGIMDTVNLDTDTYFYTARDIEPDLEALGTRIAQIFDVRARFFHFEFFRRRSDRQLIPLEVNIRAPGGCIVDTWNFADDIDLYDQWARIVTGQPFTAKWKRKWHVGYASRKDTICYKRSHEELLYLLGNKLAHFERVSPLFRNALGDSGYIIRSPKLAEIFELMHLIQEWSQ